MCRIDLTFPLLFFFLVRNILGVIIGTHRTRPPHHPTAAAAPAGVGATSGSKAFGPRVGGGGGGYGVLAEAAAANEESWKYEKVQKGRE